MDCGKDFVAKKECVDEIEATKFFIYADLNYCRCPVCQKNIKERKKRQDLTDFSNGLPLSGKTDECREKEKNR